MKRIKASKHEVLLNYKLWLSSVTGQGIIEEERYELLKKIRETGSLSAAARELKISYRKAWGDLKSAEELLGYKLADRTRGGSEGGKTTLTGKAEKLLEAYEALHKTMDDAVEKAYEKFTKKMEG
jgi:molybdate transport repressor ModE-like protein